MELGDTQAWYTNHTESHYWVGTPYQFVCGLNTLLNTWIPTVALNQAGVGLQCAKCQEWYDLFMKKKSPEQMIADKDERAKESGKAEVPSGGQSSLPVVRIVVASAHPVEITVMYPGPTSIEYRPSPGDLRNESSGTDD